MQIHQRMDVDNDHPMKQSYHNNENENITNLKQSLLNKKNMINNNIPTNKPNNNRVFGQDLTNQPRSIPNVNINIDDSNDNLTQKQSQSTSFNEKSTKMDKDSDSSFSFIKPQIIRSYSVPNQLALQQIEEGEHKEDTNNHNGVGDGGHSEHNNNSHTVKVERSLSVELDKIYGEQQHKMPATNNNNSNNGDDTIPKLEEISEYEEINDIKLSAWDACDISDDLHVTDYVDDIMSSLRNDEELNNGECIIYNNNDFMAQQKDINARMRLVLVDWLIEVHRKFKLLPNTFFLGINLLDRYLSKRQLNRRKLQLAGCTCLWIASKYHEIYAPEMGDFVYISDNAFSADDLMNMEIQILKSLSFILTVPTFYNYAQRYCKISSFYLKKEREIKIISDLIMYCIEHSVMSYDLCRQKPSLIGAASFIYSCISTKVFSIQTFKNDNLEKIIGYTLNELIPIMTQIDQIVRNAKRTKHKAVYKKYCNQKYSNIGKLNFDKLNTSFLRQN